MGPSCAPASPDRLVELRRLVRALETGGGRRERAARDAVASGWPSLGALPRGILHEWLGVAPAAGRPDPGETRWAPPLFLLAHLAAAALDADPGRAGDADRTRVVWVGRAVWPYPGGLLRDVTVEESGPARLALTHRAHDAEGDDPLALVDRSLFVDPPDAATRLWATDLALRCPSVAAVVADGSSLTLPATRRLQLAAEAGEALALLARPARERGTLSAAATRSLVRRAACDAADDLPRWTLEVLRARA